MKFMKPYSFSINCSSETAHAVLEKITGEYGKLVRENFDIKPFTGTIKKESFKLIPNLPNESFKIKGNFYAEGSNQTKIEVNGSLLMGKLILAAVFIGLFGISFIMLVGVLISEGSIIAGIGVLIIGLTIIISSFQAFMGWPISRYNEFVHHLIRKLDNHKLTL